MSSFITGRRTGSDPATGKDFGLARQMLGISARAVATELHVGADTLCRWERSAEVVAPERRAQWHAALAVCAQARARELRRAGFSMSDFQGTTLGVLLRRFGALATAK